MQWGSTVAIALGREAFSLWTYALWRSTIIIMFIIAMVVSTQQVLAGGTTTGSVSSPGLIVYTLRLRQLTFAQRGRPKVPLDG